jgi:uncharacterized protein (TIGR02271 family)
MTQGVPGDGDRRPQADPGFVLHEEEAVVAKDWSDAMHGLARRVVEHHDVAERHARSVERLNEERIPVAEGDSGEIEVLPDGSVSIPLFEEELVVTTRVVLRERVVLRKELVEDWQTVYATLRRERAEIDFGE